MKNYLVLFTLLLVGLNSIAQDSTATQGTVPQDTIWRVNGKFGAIFNQVSLTNWSAGGQNSIAGNVNFSMTANYKKGNWKWDNGIVLGYGLSKQGEDALNKTDDQIILTTALAYELRGPWYATSNVNFRTQFADGFNLPNDSVKVSGFMAPAYLVAGLGIEYEPNDNFKIFINPVTAKTLFILDDQLSLDGAYGVDPGSNVRAEFGAFLSLFYKKEVVKNVTVTTLYTMFGNYENLAAWDINWDLVIDLKINEWLAANLTTNLIYDQDVKIPVDRTGDGIKESFGPRTQFRQAFGLGLTAKFSKFTRQ